MPPCRASYGTPINRGGPAREDQGRQPCKSIWWNGSAGVAERAHSFRHSVNEDDGWPNKFELTCENAECGQEQDVPFRDCTVTPRLHAMT